MHHRSTSENLAQAMERARRHWQSRRKEEIQGEPPPEPAPAAFTIAISREAGARGADIARALGERLGWQVYDKEILQKIAAEMGFRTDLVASVDERRSSWLRECLEAFSAVPTVTTEAYVRHLIETVLSLAAHGECVIVGRGAAQILPEATTVRIRLVAKLEDRIAAIQQRLNLDPKEAAAWVDQTDRDRLRFVKDHLQKDPNDAHRYDLILNTSRFTIPECVDLILEALNRLKSRAKGTVVVGK